MALPPLAPYTPNPVLQTQHTAPAPVPGNQHTAPAQMPMPFAAPQTTPQQPQPTSEQLLAQFGPAYFAQAQLSGERHPRLPAGAHILEVQTFSLKQAVKDRSVSLLLECVARETNNPAEVAVGSTYAVWIGLQSQSGPSNAITLISALEGKQDPVYIETTIKPAIQTYLGEGCRDRYKGVVFRATCTPATSKEGRAYLRQSFAPYVA